MSDDPASIDDLQRAYRQLQFERPPGATELLIVRHGESEPAIDGQPFPLVDGHGDPALSPLGREQAERVCERLANEGVDAIWVSSLRRTAETAQPLADALDITPTVDRDLREVFLGEWEGGIFRRKVSEGDPIALRMREEQRWEVIPGAEPAATFAKRVGAVVGRIAAEHPDQRVAVFAHGGVIGEVLAQAATARPFAFTGADNASISHVVITPERWIVRRFNDTAHLEVGLTVRPTTLT